MREIKEAIAALEEKGYCICNQFNGFGFVGETNEYELWKDENCLMDRLSEAHVVQLSEFL